MIIPTEVRGKGIWDENGNYQGHICIVRDITERKQSEEAMKKYARDLEEANLLKDLFTDIIRHDLLNPVTVIKGLSEILSEDETLHKNRKSVETIIKYVGKLEEMIQSAATLAKVESVDKLDFEERNLCKILRKVMSDFTPMFRNRGMSVEFFGEAKCTAEVNPHIEDIFSNLFSNAVKYSPENTRVTVGIKGDGEEWIVSVKDRGNRIPDEYKEIIFERFKRIEKRGVKGTGLGLRL
jgi:signal transduction histidine kinase